MGKRKGQARPRLDALGYLEPHSAPQLKVALSDEFLRSSGSLARAASQARTDLTFLTTASSRLGQAGLDPRAADRLALLVASAPTIALRHSAGGGREIIHQAVVARDPSSESGECLRIALSVEVQSGLPPTVDLACIDVLPVDPGSDEDRLELLAELESWCQQFPTPENGPTPSPLEPWAVAGNPILCKLTGVPRGWQSVLNAMGKVHGRPPLIVASEPAARQAQLGQRAEGLFVLPDTPWVGPVVEQARHRVSLIVLHPSPYSFDALAGEIRRTLLRWAGSSGRQERQRALTPGEVVYHRKLPGGGNKDRFDEGSHEPCQHGADGFVPWRKADKAAKGMRARYDNFTDSMLRHCGQFPNCGMYAVDAGRLGAIEPP